MIKLRKIFAISILFALILSCAAFAADRLYVNDRFGFSFIVPAGMKAMPEPDNGDGRQFVNRQDKFEITGSGINNVLEQTAYGSAMELVPKGTKAETLAQGKDGNAKDITLRWTEGRTVKWYRVMLIQTKDDPDGHFISVYAKCPKANAKKFEGVVLTALRSLKSTGKGTD
jgi:hypothetical protein